MNPFKKTMLITIVAFIAMISTNMQAQRGSDVSIVNSQELFDTLKDDMTNPLTRDFCQEIEVTVDLVFGQITTTIIVCCSTQIFICIPNANRNIKNANNEYPNDLVISNSSSVIQGGYRVSIVPGTYSLNSKGEINKLKYKMTKI
jgi:hypothetical protein